MTKRKRKSYRKKNTSGEKELITRLVIMLVASVALLFGIFFLSVPVLSRLVTFWDIIAPPQDVRQDNSDTIAPPAPFVADAPSAVNSKFINLQGYAEAGATVKLYLNSSEAASTIVDSNGDFEFKDIALYEGTNTLYVQAVDQAGNESEKSDTFTVVQDKEKPELTLEEPENGFETSDARLEIKGTTEPNASVFVNQHQAVVQPNGNFVFNTLLNEGENTLIIEAVDRAGNKTVQELTVTYTPES